MSDTKEKAATSIWLWLVLVICFLGLLTGALWLFRIAGNATLNTPEFRESRALLEQARRQPLTDAEFDRAIVLLDNPEILIFSWMNVILELEASRNPERKAKVIAEFESLLQKTTDVTKIKSLEVGLQRIKTEEKKQE